MVPTRGRPNKIDHDRVQETILANRGKIITNEYKILSKIDQVWRTLSSAVNMSPEHLYSYVSCNRNNIRDKLLMEVAQVVDASHSSNTSVISDLGAGCVTKNFETDPDSSGYSNAESATKKVVEIHMSKKEFQDLLEYRLYRRQEKKRIHLKTRRYAVWKDGLWGAMIINKLKMKKVHCGFQFKNHKLTMTSHTASFDGECKCGTIIVGLLENTDQEIIPIKCTITAPEKDNGEACGKRYLRQPQRDELAKKLCDTNTLPNVYRMQQAAKTMVEGDPEPCDLYTNEVVTQAVYEYKKRQYRDNDPAQSLALAQQSDLKCDIHKLGRNPFYVQYWSNHQNHVYRSYCKLDHSYVTIDATGGLVRKIKHADGSLSGSIFLYEAVVSGSCGQFPVAQFLSEEHDAVAIQHWLLTWVKTGAPPPKEVRKC